MADPHYQGNSSNGWYNPAAYSPQQQPLQPQQHGYNQSAHNAPNTAYRAGQTQLPYDLQHTDPSQLPPPPPPQQHPQQPQQPLQQQHPQKVDYPRQQYQPQPPQIPEPTQQQPTQGQQPQHPQQLPDARQHQPEYIQPQPQHIQQSQQHSHQYQNPQQQPQQPQHPQQQFQQDRPQQQLQQEHPQQVQHDPGYAAAPPVHDDRHGAGMHSRNVTGYDIPPQQSQSRRYDAHAPAQYDAPAQHEYQNNARVEPPRDVRHTSYGSYADQDDREYYQSEDYFTDDPYDEEVFHKLPKDPVAHYDQMRARERIDRSPVRYDSHKYDQNLKGGMIGDYLAPYPLQKKTSTTYPTENYDVYRHRDNQSSRYDSNMERKKTAVSRTHSSLKYDSYNKDRNVDYDRKYLGPAHMHKDRNDPEGSKYYHNKNAKHDNGGRSGGYSERDKYRFDDMSNALPKHDSDRYRDPSHGDKYSRYGGNERLGDRNNSGNAKYSSPNFDLKKFNKRVQQQSTQRDNPRDMRDLSPSKNMDARRYKPSERDVRHYSPSKDRDAWKYRDSRAAYDSVGEHYAGRNHRQDSYNR